MFATTKTQERERLREISEAYREKGYTVSFEPPIEELPDFIKPFRPDMILHRGDEKIIVEVKSKSSLDPATRQQIKYLLEEVKKHPGWHFELILMPTAEDQFVGDEINLLGQAEIKAQLAIARSLIQPSTEAALLYSWALLEAVLRLVAKVENIELDRFDARYLIKKLTSEGVLSREQYHSLMEIAPLRNAISHGFQSSHLTKQTVLDLLELTNQLSEDL
jgi:hypothetical protein